MWAKTQKHYSMALYWKRDVPENRDNVSMVSTFTGSTGANGETARTRHED